MIGILLAILEMCTYIAFAVCILNLKINTFNRKYVCVFVTYCFLEYLKSYLIVPFNILYDIPIQICIFIIIFNDKIYLKIRSYFISWIVVGVLNLLFSILLIILAKNSNVYIDEFFTLTLVLLTSALIKYISSKHIKMFKTLKPEVFIYINLVFTFLIGALVLAAMKIIKPYVNSNAIVIITIVTLFIIILSLFSLNQYLSLSKQNDQFIEKSKLLEYQLSAQKEYFDTIYKQYENARSIRHDLYAHMYCMNTFINNKEYDKLEAYMRELTGSIGNTNKLYACNDLYISAVLFNLDERIHEANISFEFNYLLPKAMTLSCIERSSLIYNLMMNSIEACEKVESDRYIRLSINYVNTTIYITVVNNIEKQETLQNIKKHKTSKDNKKLHGIGLDNIDRIVKKHHGNLTFEITKSDMIEINIVLYNAMCGLAKSI